MTIGLKIGLGFVLAVLLLAGSAGLAHNSVSRQIEAAGWVVHTYEVKENLTGMLLALREGESQVRLYFVTGNESDVSGFDRTAEQARARLRKVKELTDDNRRQQERMGRLGELLEKRLTLMQQRMEERRKSGMERVVALVRSNTGQGLTAEIEALAQAGAAEEQELLKSREGQQAHLNSQLLVLLSWGTLACAVGLALVGTIITLGVTRPVREHARTLSTTAVELVAAAEEQQRVMNEQSTSVHQTATSINELAASQRYVGAQSQDAAALALKSAQAADKGSQEAALALQGLEEIRSRVASTTDQIVTLSDKARMVGRAGQLISDVTEHINILALNAAVEAARAGENGRGFTVVAAEVRRLADRTRTSAQEVISMMAEVQSSAQSTVVVSEDTTRTVERGTRQADNIGELFSSLTQIVDESAQAADRIRLACQEQQQASEQITVALGPLTLGMQQTVVASQQVSTSARQLEEVAQQLRVLVG